MLDFRHAKLDFRGRGVYDPFPPDIKTPFPATQPLCRFTFNWKKNQTNNHDVLGPGALMCGSRLFLLKWAALSSVDRLHPGIRVQPSLAALMGLLLPTVNKMILGTYIIHISG